MTMLHTYMYIYIHIDTYMYTYIYTCMGCPSDPNQIYESPVSETRIAFKSWPAKPQPPMTSMCHIKCVWYLRPTQIKTPYVFHVLHRICCTWQCYTHTHIYLGCPSDPMQFVGSLASLKFLITCVRTQDCLHIIDYRSPTPYDVHVSHKIEAQPPMTSMCHIKS